MRLTLLVITTTLALAACAEDESTCNELETICAACQDAESVMRCETLLKRRDQVDCSLALDDLRMICVGDGGLTVDAALDVDMSVDMALSVDGG
ncbi:MAG: hypothetical protein R3F60_00060 [bacterium]